MSWDQPIHSFSYPNGEPQTPTRTPPTTFFGDAAFQTPKLESSFFDPRVTWDTSDPYASSPEFLRTPKRFGLNTPRLPEQKSTQDPGSPKPLNGKPLSSQVETARKRRPSKPEDGSRTVESTKSAASMQTPPPSSASRNKVTEFGELSNTGRRPLESGLTGEHLETPSRVMGASPRLFGGLPSSPDPFQLGTINPSASPFFPQQKLFWDHGLEQHTADLGLSGGEGNLFDSANTDTFHVSSTNPTQEYHIPQLPHIEGGMELPEFNSSLYALSSGAPTDAALFPAPFSTSPRLPLPKADDPALFLSSPARRFGGTQPTPEKRLFPRQRQPYHHQTEEFRREELRRAQGVNPHLSEYEDDDDYTPRQSRPTLTRSLTVNAVSANRPGSGGTMSSASGIRKSPSKGRSSPIKPLRAPLPRSNSVASGFPRRSQSVVLKIGKDGRAKAEMQPVLEASTGLTDPVGGMDLDGSATESEYDSAEFPEYPPSSRNPSFAFSEAGRPNIARSDSGSRPPSMGSYTSSHSGRVSPWATAPRGPARRPALKATLDDWKRTPKRQTAMLHSDLSYSSAASIPGSIADAEEDTGDAQHALRKVLQNKGRIPRSQTFASFGSRSNRSLQSLTQLQSSPPRFGVELDSDAREANTSPTTITDPDLATPCTDRYSNPSNGTRCICNSMDNGGHLMIQCESCSHWLHTKCVGLERSNLPSVYVCLFCAQTPSRKNRARVPVSDVGHAPTSPLAHKSYQFR
ncbi:PHD finger domain protein [Aspergillus undulatus]|uniref:PHD finger domain protein n=1 Tax=Aspergillus undulatus TaxID=1810928 RepID=UPI003CCE4B5D